MTRTVITVTLDLAEQLSNDEEVALQEAVEWSIVDICENVPEIVGIHVEGRWEQVAG